MLSAQLFAQLHEPNIIRCLPTDSLLSEAATSLIHFPLYVHFVRGQVVSEAARVSVTLATLDTNRRHSPFFTAFRSGFWSARSKCSVIGVANQRMYLVIPLLCRYFTGTLLGPQTPWCFPQVYLRATS